MNYQIKISTIKMAFTLFGIAFFTRLIGGISALLTDSRTQPYVENVVGSLTNKVFGTFILFTCLWLAFRYKRMVPMLTDKRQALFLLFCFYALASVLWSVAPGISFRRVMFLFSVAAFSYYLVTQYDAETIFKNIGYTIGVCAVLSILSGLVIPEKVILHGGDRAGALMGIFGDKNGAARTYMMGMTMLIYPIMQKNRTAIFFFVCCAICLAFARSVSGILLSFISVGTVLYFYCMTVGFYNKTKLTKPRVRFAIFGYIAIIIAAYSIYAVIIEMFGRDANLTNRTLIWELIIPSIYEKWHFGWGFGAYWASWASHDFIERWSFIGNAHNGYIETLLHGGLSYLTLLVGTLIIAIYRYFKFENLSRTPLINYICVGLIAALIVGNYIGYIIPNYNAIDFFIFSCVIMLSANNIEFIREKNDIK